MPRGVVCLLPLGAALLLATTCSTLAADAVVAAQSAGANATQATAPIIGGAATTAAQAASLQTNGNQPVPPPVASGGIGDTLSDLKKYFTITCDVREGYDDNIETSNTNKVASIYEYVSPSILFSYPMDDSTFDARYTAGITYYNHTDNGQNVRQDHDVVVRYNHAFSDRFNLDLRDAAGYHVDPSLLQSIGTVNEAGGYYSNIFTAEFDGQWTPLFGTVTSYSNNFIEYENGDVGSGQNSDENTASQDFRFAFWPTVTFAAGLIYDQITYFDSPRGYANYTGNVGADWQALPSLSLGFRVGGSVTEVNSGNTSSTSPYASANINWQLGERSRLIGSYVHSVTPSDFVIVQGQESDRFTVNFLYNITESITAHLEGIYTNVQYETEFAVPQGPTSGFQGNTSETDSQFDTGVTYHYNQYLDFELGYTFTIVQSGEAFRDYTRNQFYIGARGTY